MTSLTVIVPTIGRSSLRATLSDLAAELDALDEVLVVGDGPQPSAAALVDELARTTTACLRYFETPATRCYGNAQRQAALSRARGTHLWFVDDDDRVVRGAARSICSSVKTDPDRPHLFRGWYVSGLLWRHPRIECGNVSSQMAVVPNCQDRLGVWTNRYEGDFDFISSTIDRYPDKRIAVVWSEAIVIVQGSNGRLVPHPPGILR